MTHSGNGVTPACFEGVPHMYQAKFSKTYLIQYLLGGNARLKIHLPCSVMHLVLRECF